MNIYAIFSCTYELEDKIIDRLEFYFCSKIGNNGNSKNVVLPLDRDFHYLLIRTEDEKDVPPRSVNINDISVHEHNEKGDSIDEDCSCDRAFVLSAIDTTGNAIRSTSY